MKRLPPELAELLDDHFSDQETADGIGEAQRLYLTTALDGPDPAPPRYLSYRV